MISFIKGAKNHIDFPNTNKEIVIIGKSNVGKSSFINALFGKIAYVGKTPGKTRMLNFFNVDNKYTVCDVPGYGYAKRNDDEYIDYSDMMDEYFSYRKELKICVLLLDIRHNPTNDDLDMYEYLKELKVPYIIVLNKSDKLSYSQKLKKIDEISKELQLDKKYINTCSCTTKDNISYIKDFIQNKLDI